MKNMFKKVITGVMMASILCSSVVCAGAAEVSTGGDNGSEAVVGVSATTSSSGKTSGASNSIGVADSNDSVKAETESEPVCSLRSYQRPAIIPKNQNMRVTLKNRNLMGNSRVPVMLEAETNGKGSDYLEWRFTQGENGADIKRVDNKRVMVTYKDGFYGCISGYVNTINGNVAWFNIYPDRKATTPYTFKNGYECVGCDNPQLGPALIGVMNGAIYHQYMNFEYGELQFSARDSKCAKSVSIYTDTDSIKFSNNGLKVSFEAVSGCSVGGCHYMLVNSKGQVSCYDILTTYL